MDDGADHEVDQGTSRVEIDDEVLAGVTRLSELGYPIALDDFVWGLGHERLLHLTSYVKLDLLDGDADRIAELVDSCRQYPDIRLVAERVERDLFVRRVRACEPGDDRRELFSHASPAIRGVGQILRKPTATTPPSSARP